MPGLFTAHTRQIRVATPRDLQMIIDLQQKLSNAIGFIPQAGVEVHIERGNVRIALENETPAGFVLGAPTLRWNIAIRPITQAAIYFDAQRRHHGLSLVGELETDARNSGQMALQANCREGLEANEFWRIAGFTEICRLEPQTARGRQIICWRKCLRHDFEPAWFHIPPPYAGHRARKVR